MTQSRATMLALALTAFVGTATNVAAQETGVLSGVVRSANGTMIANARISISAGARDTTVRSNSAGFYAVVIPVGQARIVARMIGYQPFEQTVSTTGDYKLDIALQSLPQQLAGVEVRDEWIGIRGIVGDDRTMTPLAGVVITSMSRGIRVVTDSQGRFQFSLPKAERTTMQLSSPSYLTRPAVVSMAGVKSADVTLLMTQGEDPIHMETALVDLSHRMSWGGIKMFVASPEELSRHGAKNLADGIRESGLLARKGIEGGGCLFVNGVPQPNMGPGQIPIASIDFVEVWGFNAEQPGTLAARWPGGSCSGGRRRGKNGDGPWISVWLRR